MDFNAKKWGPLVAAIVLGGIAAKAGFDVVSHRPSEKVIVQKVTHVVAAKDDLPPGSSLRVIDLVATNVPESSSPGGTFDSPERLVGRVTTVPLRKGQPVFETMLAPEGSSRGLTAVVPEGMRAVTMEINEFSGVAGLIVPGCKVDVVSTFPSDNGQMMTKTVCRSLRIMAVGRKYNDPTPKDGKEKEPPSPRDGDAEPPLARSVTLLVTPREAEILDLAAHTGSPRLVLRSSRDGKDDLRSGMSEGVTVAELRNTSTAKPSAWVTVLTNIFSQTAKANAPAKATVQVVDDTRLSDPLNLFGQHPSTQPSNFRQVTVIRATKEETVRVETPVHEVRRGVLVNTDSSDAIPEPKHED
jgi:pilus assembly protein CpaB